MKLFKNFILKELIRASTAMKANIDTLQIDVLKKGVNGYLDKNLTKAQKVDLVLSSFHTKTIQIRLSRFSLNYFLRISFN